MEEEQYEHITVHGLSSFILGQFDFTVLPDNSVSFIRSETGDVETEMIKLSDNWRGDKVFRLTVGLPKTAIKAAFVLARTSPNHYVISGFSEKGFFTGYAKNISEAGSFISQHFCRTLMG